MSDAPAIVASRAKRVTVFEDRAEVVRTATVRVNAGQSWVSIGGVSPFVDERSVQVRVEHESVRVLGARVVWSTHAERALGREAIEAIEHEARRCAAKIRDARDAVERAVAAQQRLTRSITAWTLAMARVPRGIRAESATESWRGALDRMEAALDRALSDADTARRMQTAASDEHAHASTRLREGSIESPRFEARVEIQLAVEKALEGVPVEITYRVGAAAWRPEHLARLTMEPSGAAGVLEIATFATVWQRTGESWDDVEVRFSTARPARSADPPTIADDVLIARRKADWERNRVVVEAREQEVVVAGLGRGARSIDEMPGMDDGGEPRVYAAKTAVALPSDARPTRVEIARVLLPADVARVIIAERTQAAHVRATATLKRSEPILAGPVRVGRGTSLVGRGRIGYVAAGEPFELGFGVDDGVRARRAVREERDTTSITGTQRVRRTVTVHVSNLSDQPRTVQVTERLPVSEIGEVTVHLVESGAWVFAAADGLARQSVDLAPGGTRSLSLTYEIRASSKVMLPF